MNRLTGITYPDSSTVSSTYDSRGRRTSITDANGHGGWPTSRGFRDVGSVENGNVL